MTIGCTAPAPGFVVADTTAPSATMQMSATPDAIIQRFIKFPPPCLAKRKARQSGAMRWVEQRCHKYRRLRDVLRIIERGRKRVNQRKSRREVATM